MPVVYGLTLIVGVQFALVHILAEYFSLYWRYVWLDIPMHCMGGVFMALVWCSVVRMRIGPRWIGQRSVFLGLAVIAIVAWEGFGIYRFGGLKPDFIQDSSLDVVFGILGVVGGYYLSRSLARIG